MNNKLAFGILFFAFFIGVTGCVSAQAPSADASGVFLREQQGQTWKQMVAGVDFSSSKSMEIKFGDVVVTREKPLIFKFGTSVITMMPFSVLRINGSEEQGRITVVPELLFGEALFRGAEGVVRLPGQAIRARDVAYFVVDDEKYSSAAAVKGVSDVLPDGATAAISIPAGNMLELGPSGESGAPEPLQPEDINFYTSQSPPAESPNMKIAGDAKPIPLEPSDEFWTRERLAMLKDGPESAVGLAIASGKTMQQPTAQPVENIQVFDPKKGPQQKTMSFSSTVAVEKKSTEPPRLTSLTIGKKRATPGDTITLASANLDDKTFVVSGKTAITDPDQWKLVIKINGEEFPLDNVSNFEYTVRISQEMQKLPKVLDITIGEEQTASFRDETILTRENLTSGRLQIMGKAEPGENSMKYSIDIVAKDADGNETALGNFPVEVNLTGLQRVEVSIDGGSSWESAKGTDDWQYVFGPQNDETYKVKVRAVDVSELISEEGQQEPYIFEYRYKTDEEALREVFENMMRAFSDKDRLTFLKYISQDFRSNNVGLRDYNDLENSVKDRFDCCIANVKYTIRETDASRLNKRGTVEFYWTLRGAVVTESNFAQFYFVWDDSGEWLLSDVIDANTFLRPSRNPYRIELTVEKNHVTADGESTSKVTAHVLDNAGSPVGDNVVVSFQADSGSMSPSSERTLDGYASVEFRAPTTPGTATITASSGDASQQTTIVLDPAQPPLPPD